MWIRIIKIQFGGFTSQRAIKAIEWIRWLKKAQFGDIEQNGLEEITVEWYIWVTNSKRWGQ